ncbi:hypothetical protein HY415_01830 [Candidatus Kaiserbacteria bacterium]|nr:hypothetical protein [Candidatus Kaiserbacteria bacterium]
MSHKRLWVAAAIISFFILAGFMFSVPHTRDIAQVPIQESAPVIPSVTLRDIFKKGVHTITGSVEAPNACTTVTALASLRSGASGAGGIEVAITLSNGTGVCLELPTQISFSTTIAAPAGAPITATINGVTATISS